MNKIDELIAQYCPNGVEFKKLGDLCDVLRGKRLTKKNFRMMVIILFFTVG